MMTLKTFLTINAILFIPFGLWMLIAPSTLFPPILDVNLSDDGLLIASMVGSMLLSFGLICLVSRNEPLGTHAMNAILLGNFTFHIIDSIMVFKGSFTGTMNNTGFLFSTMHILMALGFIYFYIQSRKLGSQQPESNFSTQ